MRIVVTAGFLLAAAPLLCGQDPNRSVKTTVEVLSYRICVVNHEYSLPAGHGVSTDSELRLRYRITLHNPTHNPVELNGWETFPDYAIADNEENARAGTYVTDAVTDSTPLGPPPTRAASQFNWPKRIAPRGSLLVRDEIRIVLWSLPTDKVKPGQNLYLQFWVKLEPTRRSSPTFDWLTSRAQRTEPVRFQLPDGFGTTVKGLAEQLNRKKVVVNKELCTAGMT